MSTLLLASPAAGDEAPHERLRLRYSLGPGVKRCPDEDRLREEVELRKGYELFDEAATGAVDVSIVRRAGNLVARIVYRNTENTVFNGREFSLPETECSCWSLITYVAVFIAFNTNDPSPREPPAPPPQCPSIPEPVKSAPPAPPPPPAPPAPVPEREDSRSFELGAGALGGVFSAPRLSQGTYWFAALRWPSASLAIEGQTLSSSAGTGEGDAPLQVALLSGAVVPCLRGRYVFGCSALQIGALRLSRGSSDADRKGGFFTGFAVRGGVELPLSDWLSLRARVELGTTISPSVIRLDERDTFRTPALFGNLGVDVAFAL